MPGFFFCTLQNNREFDPLLHQPNTRRFRAGGNLPPDQRTVVIAPARRSYRSSWRRSAPRGRFGRPRQLLQALLYLLHPCSRALSRHSYIPVHRVRVLFAEKIADAVRSYTPTSTPAVPARCTGMYKCRGRHGEGETGNRSRGWPGLCP